MKITKARLKKLIREELSYLKEDDMPFKVMITASGAPAQFKDLAAAIKTATIWEREGLLKPEGTSPEVMDALDTQAGRHPGGAIGE